MWRPASLRTLMWVLGLGLSAFVVRDARAATIASVIDDFESGNFSLTATSATGIQSVAQGSLPVLGGSRESVAFISISDITPPPEDSVTVSVSAGSATVSVTSPTPPANAGFQLRYDGLADGALGSASPRFDLTSGGADRFLLQVTELTGAVPLLGITVADSRGPGFSRTVLFEPVLGPNEVMFSSFTGIDFTNVSSVRINHRPLFFEDAKISFASFATAGLEPLQAAVDIMPGGEVNPINLKSKGVISVAILGSESFDVAQVDVTTLAFGPAGATPSDTGSHLEDIDADGFADLVSHYRTQETGIGPGDTEACVTGELLDETTFEGCDAVQIRPPAR